MITKTKVKELVEERIAELDNGLFVVEINISKSNVINVELDKYEGNVSVMDCVSVSRNVEHNLDREEADFELHVSSAGLDKPFRVEAQFQKNIGREVEVLTQANVKEVGELVSFDKNALVLRQEKKVKREGQKKKEIVVEENSLPFSEIKETKIVISFK